jgi:predicted site-specific integrase-resolvase
MNSPRAGRSVQTVRRWEREGKLTAKLLPSDQRYFDESDVRSGKGQKDDLASQVTAMEAYCLAAAPPVDVLLQEIGGGAIVHTFSCRLYGMRKYQSAIKEDFPQYKLSGQKDELQ